MLGLDSRFGALCYNVLNENTVTLPFVHNWNCNFYNPHHNSFTHVLSKYKWSTWGFCRGSDKRKNYVTRITILMTQTYYSHVNIFLRTKLLHRIPAPQNNIVWLWKTLILPSHRFRRYQSDWTVYDLVFIPFSEGFLYLISDVHNVTNYTYTIYR